MQNNARDQELNSATENIAPVRSVTVLRPETFQLSGRDALWSNVRAVAAVSDVIKTTLGPRSRMKLIADTRADRYTLTNDGATVVNALAVTHPAASLVLGAARAQDARTGDGTTSTVLYCGELLQCLAARLAHRAHVPVRALIEHCRAAQQCAHVTLRGMAVGYTTDLQELKRRLQLMAVCALSTKHVAVWRELLSSLAVDSMLHVTRVKARDVRVTRDITLVRVPGPDITCSFWSPSVMFSGDLKVTPRDMMTGVTARSRDWHQFDSQKSFVLCLLSDDLSFTEPDVKPTPVSSISLLTRVYSDAKETEYWQQVSDVIAKFGITLMLVCGEISSRGQSVLAARDCMAIQHVSREALTRLSGVTGVRLATARFLNRLTARQVSKVSNLVLYSSELHPTRLFSVPHADHASIVLCAATRELLRTVEIDLHDALRVLETSLRHEQLMLPGAGACEMEISVQLSALAEQMTGLKREVFQSYIEALEVVPTILAANAGVIPVNVIAKLRSEHRKGNRLTGVNGVTGEIVPDAVAAGIVEPFMVKDSVLKIATEITCTILSVDQIVIERSIIDKMLTPVTQ